MTTAPTWDSGEIVLFKFNTTTVASLPIISFAFTFHANIHSIWHEMKNPSKENILMASWSSVLTCYIVYLSVGVVGYLAFLEDVRDNILLELKDDVLMNIGKLGYAFIICFSYPVIAYPIRVAIDVTLFPDKQPPSRLRVTLEALGIYIITFILGITVPGISVVFGLTGSTAGGMVVFLLPCTYYLHLKKNPMEYGGKYPWWVYRYFSKDKILTLLTFALGVFIAVGGTFSVIYDLVK